MLNQMPTETAAQTEQLAQAQYPYVEPYPVDQSAEDFGEQRRKWSESRSTLIPAPGYSDGLEGFFKKTVGEFLADPEGENRVYSPLSLYMALAMAAETADGESREQILSLIGQEDIESLRAQAKNIWLANYANDGATTSIMANSLWFDNGFSYVEDTVGTIAENYYASVFTGEMGSDSMDQAIHAWLNEQTGGLLEEQVQNLETDPSMLMALFSTVYYRAKWKAVFDPTNNEMLPFHTPSGDTEEEFMYLRTRGNYYWSENFSAVTLQLENSGAMWLVLPDEGVSTDDLLADDKLYELVYSGKMYISEEDWPDQKNVKINLRMPKFDVVSDFGLTEGLKKLGVTDIFTAGKADLTPLVGEDSRNSPAYSAAKQAARVTVDEEGVTAAAYTAMLFATSAMPPKDEVDFTLDRPFIFALSHADGLTLFTGVVSEP